MQTLVFIFFILLGITFYFIMYRKTKDILNPFGISSFLWLFVAAFANLRLSYLQSQWGIEMHFIVIAAAIAIFMAGVLTVPYSDIFYYPKESVHITGSYKKLTRFVFILSIICAVMEWKNSNYYISNFSQVVGADLKVGLEGISVVHYGTILLPYCALYSFYELIFDNKKGRFSNCYNFFVICTAALFSYFVLVSRGTLLIIVMGIIYMYHCKFRLKSWKVLTLIILVLLGFIYMASIRLVSSSLVFTAATKSSGFNAIYTYATFSFENLNKLVEQGSPFTIIYCSILRHILQLVNLDTLNIIEFNTAFFNTRTFLYEFYYDMGFFGTFIYPFSIYLFIGFLYRKIRNNGANILILASIQKGIFTIFFANYLSGMLVIIWPIVVTIYVARTLTQPQKSSFDIKNKNILKNT